MYAENGSKTEDMKTLLSKFNSFWKTAKEKNGELNQCQCLYCKGFYLKRKMILSDFRHLVNPYSAFEPR